MTRPKLITLTAATSFLLGMVASGRLIDEADLAYRIFAVAKGWQEVAEKCQGAVGRVPVRKMVVM